MRTRKTTRRGRPAFTLIELLVVIAIIGVLVALLMVAVIPMLNKGPELQTAQDISQFGNAVQTWQTTFKVRFPPPSQLFLSNNYNDYSGNSAQAPTALRQLSLAYLTQIWPRLTSNWNAGNPTPKGFDWSGGLDTGGVLTKGGGVVLQGDQCLVFFLGGIPSSNASGTFGCVGFATNPTNPTQLTDASGNPVPRIPPQFEFEGGRLFQQACTKAAGGGSVNIFLSYRDGWSTAQAPRPYIYFSSGKRRNGYNSLAAQGAPDVYNGQGAPSGGNVQPFYTGAAAGATQYLNPTTFQIVSAGKNGTFGPGGLYDPTLPAGAYAGITTTGGDDQSNFTDGRLLGVQQ